MFTSEKLEMMRNVLQEFEMFWNELRIDEHVYSLIPSKVSQANQQFKADTGLELTELQSLILLDAMRCSQKLGHPFASSKATPEGRFVVLLITVICDGSSDLTHANDEAAWMFYEAGDMWQRMVTLSTRQELFAVISSAELNLAYLFKTHHYFEKYALRYAVLLYRFSSVLAELDNRITPTEKSWLNQLMENKSQLEEVKIMEWDANDDPMADLQAMVGLDVVKQEVENQQCLIQVQQLRQQKKLPIVPVSYHYVFTGHPGTGKTTIARILARMYKKLGVLKKGHLVEADRSSLVAEWLGQTEAKTTQVINSALGGVLFIDEAYSLTSDPQDGYGKVAVDVLLKRMEDERENLVVILAGYPDQMQQFINSNPGLKSRFNRNIFFPDYTAQELTQIFRGLMRKYQYQTYTTVTAHLTQHLEEKLRANHTNFGNARYVRNLFEQCVIQQSKRLCKRHITSTSQLQEITLDDLKLALQQTQ